MLFAMLEALEAQVWPLSLAEAQAEALEAQVPPPPLCEGMSIKGKELDSKGKELDSFRTRPIFAEAIETNP